MQLSYLEAVWSFCILFLWFASWIWPKAQSRANNALLLKQELWVLNPMPHELWDVPVQLVVRATTPGPVWAFTLFPSVLLLGAFPGLAVSSPARPGTAESAALTCWTLQGPVPGAQRAGSLSVCTRPLPFLVLGTLAASVSLDSQLHLLISESLWTLPEHLLLAPRPGNSLQAVIWDNRRAHLICFQTLSFVVWCPVS